MTRDEWIGVAEAAAATLCFSTGAILVRWAGELSPVEVTSLRMLLGAVFVGAAAWAVGDPLRIALAEWARLLPIGLVAALHFLCFIACLAFTSVAHALTLTYTAPFFIVALSHLTLKEPLPRRALPGSIVTLAGIAVLAGFEPKLSQRMLFGDLLAVAAAVTFALYSILGRRERSRLPLLTYAGGVYLVAGLATGPFAAVFAAPSHPLRALAAVFAMALVPSALGHTLYNAAIRRLHPSIPNLIATQEVTLGILLAWLILGESLTWNVVAGAVLTILGVGLVLR